MSSRMGWPPLQGGGHSHAARRGVQLLELYSQSAAKCAWKLQPREPPPADSNRRP
jgi:hypothetical protein